MYCRICRYMLREGEETKICPICGSIFNEENLVENDPGEGATTVLTNEPEEAATTVLTADPEEGTVVLSSENMKPGRTPLTPNDTAQNNMAQNNTAPDGMPLYPDAKKAEKKLKKSSKKKMSKGKKLAIFIIIFVIVAVLGTIGVLFGLKISNYSKAQSALNNGNIEEAVELYNKAVPYKDSDDMANGGAYYEYAEALFNAGNYYEAAEYFEKSNAYGDSEEMLQTCYMNYANRLFDKEEYEEAITYYEMAGDPEDAEMAEKINSCKYMVGCSLMDEEDYEGAIEVFEGLGDYEDSDDKIKECYYYQALNKMEAGEYEEARDLFLQAETSDGEKMANECIYLLATQYEEEGDYENAIATYEQVDSSYRNCTSKIKKAYIAWGDLLLKQKDYTGAIDAYANVDSSEAEDKINEAKADYIKSHLSMSNETTMSYLCDLRYLDYGDAETEYEELTGWTINSFVNYEDTEIDDKEETVSADKDIYVHTLYSNADDESLNITGYIYYSDGTKSNEVSFSGVTSDKVSWLQITADSAPVGDTTLYLYDDDTGYLLEKYTFVIE